MKGKDTDECKNKCDKKTIEITSSVNVVIDRYESRPIIMCSI